MPDAPRAPTPQEIADAAVANARYVLTQHDAGYGLAGDSIASVAPLRLRTGEVRPRVVQPEQQGRAGHAGRDRRLAQEPGDPSDDVGRRAAGHAGRRQVNITVNNTFNGNERPEQTIAEITERELQLAVHKGDF